MLTKLRLISGLIMFLFVICHYVNHMFGLHSLALMNEARHYLLAPWHHLPTNVLLMSAIFVHAVLAIKSIVDRRTFQLAVWEWLQLISGVLIPFLLMSHVVGAIAIENAFDAVLSYQLVMVSLWVSDPLSGVLQAIALLVVWIHGCVGIHYWLRTKEGYQKWLSMLSYVVIVIPTLALAGYLSAGFEILELSKNEDYIKGIIADSKITMAMVTEIRSWASDGRLIFLALLLVPLLRYVGSKILHRFKKHAKLKYIDGRSFRVAPGANVLEILRANNIPLASVCGGRGRCTTCRVQITDGLDLLDEPGETEAKALARIGAEKGLRLACQTYPTSDIGVLPLLPADATASDGRRPGGLEGQEKFMSIMFIDLRGSTKLGEEKLPYDVLFILNRFFAEMTLAINETKGHYAQFNGDGLMALYGLNDSDEKLGAKQIIEGARAMLLRLQGLNETLKSELATPLKIGIGIHFGEAIVGVMGPPQSQLTTAIGDNINIAARLESLTKEYNRSIVISQKAAETAGISLSDCDLHEVVVRGRDAPIHFYAVDDILLAD